MDWYQIGCIWKEVREAHSQKQCFSVISTQIPASSHVFWDDVFEQHVNTPLRQKILELTGCSPRQRNDLFSNFVFPKWFQSFDRISMNSLNWIYLKVICKTFFDLNHRSSWLFIRCSLSSWGRRAGVPEPDAGWNFFVSFCPAPARIW